jgi:heme A synthase
MAPVTDPAPESREELIQHLEKLTGRSLKTRADIAAYVREAAARSAADTPSVQRWTSVKKITLIALFAFGLIQYYILEVMLEIATMHNTTYFVPARALTQKS